MPAAVVPVGVEPVEVEPEPEPDEEAEPPRTLATSVFKRLYDTKLLPVHQHQLMGALHMFIERYCAIHELPEGRGRSFFEELQEEAFSNQANTQQMLKEIPAGAQRLWTSGKRMSGVEQLYAKELCSMLNEAVRLDDEELLTHGVLLVIAINQLCVVRGIRAEAELKFPKDGICFRGGGLPDEHKAFFQDGLKYRVPGFLATSFSEAVILPFCYNAYDNDVPAVKWVIHLDSRGETDFSYRCKHVNFVESRYPLYRSLLCPR